ncbi:hypothetical protein DKX38_017320 [Salix brachista]|uniref:Leucine-rich repeat-containing N-terminal plant-type domain-containing protein n=1 Tax=Salix brachista TaxID=2182728 RepID=A0A5N5KUY2_9ROSI|nr:hypothetical protein DKX38_017320 [Salix brachista]
MLMMFQQLVQVCQVMVIISFSSSITSLASLLPPGEVAALRQIGKTLNEDGRVSLNLGDRCESGKNVTITRYPPTRGMTSTISCNCSIGDDKFCHITSFELKDYDLSGRLPPDLANLTYVRKISLTANRLSGNIPGYLGNFTALNYLILSSNKLVGTLPEALAQIKDLGDFRVSDNNLNGTVPKFIGSWTQLRRLGLCATGLQGPVPSAIFLLEKLNDLKISDTPGPEFRLPIVPKNMKFLVLRNINLNGTIPEEAWSVEKTL